MATKPHPSCLFISIEGPFPGRQAAYFQAQVEEIKINASKDAVNLMLSVMAPKGFHRGCKYGGESCYVLSLLTELDVKNFSSKFNYKTVGKKKKQTSGTWIFRFFPYQCPSNLRWGCGDMGEARNRLKYNWRKTMRKLSLI